MSQKGIILLSHGSRLPEAQATSQQIAAALTKALGDKYIVEGAALQFNQPDLPTAIEKVIQAGAQKIVVAPIFLYPGLHIQRDIPEIIEEHKNKYPGVEISMTRHIGADRRLMEIMLDRIKEVSF